MGGFSVGQGTIKWKTNKKLEHMTRKTEVTVLKFIAHTPEKNHLRLMLVVVP
jgi:hypothetical protein